MIFMKITKLALLANKIHEIYYVFINSYPIKIKKPGPKSRYFSMHSTHFLPAYSAFMETRNSSLDSVLLSRLIRNSMASMEVMSER